MDEKRPFTESVRCGVCNADGYVLDDSGTAMVPCPRCYAVHFAESVRLCTYCYSMTKTTKDNCCGKCGRPR